MGLQQISLLLQTLYYETFEISHETNILPIWTKTLYFSDNHRNTPCNTW